MTAKELIVKLLDMNANSAQIRMKTSNKDDEGAYYVYGFKGVDNELTFDSINGEHFVSLLFEDWRMDTKKSWFKNDKGEYECPCCGYSVYADDVEDFRFCPWCGRRLNEGENKDGENV